MKQYLQRTWKAGSILALTAFLVLFGFLSALRSPLSTPPSASAQTFTGPGTCTAGNCSGTVGTDVNKNLGINAAPISTAKLYVVASTSNTYAITASGTIYILHGSLTFPDGTSQSTAYLAAGGLASTSAPNVSAGSFGANTGGGLYSFPSGISANGSTPVGTTGVEIYGTVTRGVDSQITGTGAANYAIIGNSTGAGTTNYGIYGSASGASTNYGLYIYGGTSYLGGNVGIGTTGPLYTLEVDGNGGLINSSDFTGATTDIFRIGATALNNAYLGLGANQTSHYTYVQSKDAGIGYYSLLLNPNGGNVGIGTTGPSASLHVAGAGPGNPGSLKLQDTSLNGKTWELGEVLTAGNFEIYDTAVGSRFTILTGGNVGIGTTGPVTKLDVNGGDLQVESGQGRFKGWYNTGTGLALEVGIYSGTGYVQAYDRTASAYGNLILNGSNVLIGTNTGANVGIGTSTPAQLLSVGTPGGAANSFYNIGASTVGVGSSLYSYGYICAGNSNGGCTGTGGVVINSTGVKFPDGTTQTTAYLGSGGFASTSAPNVSSGSFGANTGGGNYTFPAYLGVGGAPSYALDVTSANAGYSRIYLHPQTVTDYALMQWYNGGGTYYLGPDNSTGSGLGSGSAYAFTNYVPASTPITWAQAGVEKMRIAANGNVGIGTAGPGVKLDVEGGYVKVVSGDNSTNAYLTVLPQNLSQSVNIGYNHVFEGGTNGNNSLQIDSQGAGYLILQASGGTGNVGIATSTPGYTLTVAGTIYSSTGGFRFPDGTTQTTAYLAAGGLASTSAPNVSAGSFGANTGGGNYSFPGVVTLTSSGVAQINLNSAGTYYGILDNPSAQVWGLGWGSGTTITGNALTWNASGGVAIPSTSNPGLNVGNGTTGYVQIGSSGWYDDGTYFSPLGARNFYVRSTSPVSYIYSPSIYLGDGSSANNVYFRNETLSGTSWSLTSGGILTLPTLTTDSNIKAGPYEIEGYGVNNNWSADNLYYNAGWKYRANGYAEQIYYSSGQIVFYTAPNNAGGAGAAASPTAQLTIGNTGAITVANTLQIGASGGTIQNVSNSYYQVNSMGWYVPNSWVIADNVRARGGYYYLGASDLNAIQGTDTYLRLNNANSFSSGVYTPGAFRADGASIFYGGITMYTSGLNMNSLGITNLATPVNSTDAATKGYVDTAGAVRYMGVTATAYNGNLGGIVGANAKCNAAYAGSHMCTEGEIIRSGATSLSGTTYAWISCDLVHGTICDGPTYSLDAGAGSDPSCGQWTVGTQYVGVGIHPTLGQVYQLSCTNSLAISCCK